MSARARDLPAHPCPRTCDHRVLSDAGGVEHEAGEGDVDPRVEAHVAIARLHVRDRVHDGATHLDERVGRDLVHILDANVDLAVASNGTSRSIAEHHGASRSITEHHEDSHEHTMLSMSVSRLHDRSKHPRDLSQRLNPPTARAHQTLLSVHEYVSASPPP